MQVTGRQPLAEPIRVYQPHTRRVSLTSHEVGREIRVRLTQLSVPGSRSQPIQTRNANKAVSLPATRLPISRSKITHYTRQGCSSG